MSKESTLPSYLASAKPNPSANRAPWYTNTAPTYAGIFLWFVFWSYSLNSGTPGGMLSAGVGVALISVLVAALLCHFGFYLLLARFGQKTGLPLYIVGSSTFGAIGGFLLPGFFMGLLQFGWVAVNTYGSTMAMNTMFNFSGIPLYLVMCVWAVAAVVCALKGIQYVAKFSTYLPLIPLAILLVLLAKTIGGVSSFDAEAFTKAHVIAGKAPLSPIMVLAFALTFIVGFFATAGAAGVDFGTSARNKRDVQLGGLVGVSLAITAFPSACFSSLIAANSIKTTLPKVNPWISCGIGCVVALALAISGVAGKCVAIFGFIGASFGPICGAIAMEYVLSKGRWSGPRAGFNPAGWLSWALGFLVGVQPNFEAQCGFVIPAAPVFAFVVGAVVYALCVKFQTAVLKYPQADLQAKE